MLGLQSEFILSKVLYVHSHERLLFFLSLLVHFLISLTFSDIFQQNTQKTTKKISLRNRSAIDYQLIIFWTVNLRLSFRLEA